MRFSATPLSGVFELELERHDDARGFFARTWCAREFGSQGLPDVMVQGSVSHNARKGTLRGMHFQRPPSSEGKLVRCERGAVHDVVVDLRPGSATFLGNFAVRLEADRGNALYIPPGLAHGFQTLQDDCRVTYMMTDYFAPELACGFRFDDPAFGIVWPLAVTVLSDRDRSYPDFDRDVYASGIGEIRK
jgi:dTDP-4-dehydrorhamnose 3,5-epimerase